jgi:hypothetical protein
MAIVHPGNPLSGLKEQYLTIINKGADPRSRLILSEIFCTFGIWLDLKLQRVLNVE